MSWCGGDGAPVSTLKQFAFRWQQWPKAKLPGRFVFPTRYETGPVDANGEAKSPDATPLPEW
ncbi:MAG: hypothetical protein WAV85_13145, partial [Rhodoferax sp.]